MVGAGITGRAGITHGMVAGGAVGTTHGTVTGPVGVVIPDIGPATTLVGVEVAGLVGAAVL